ncbi:MAG: endonuclease III [Patescibacteria group bacterium]
METRVRKILDILNKLFLNPVAPLHFSTPFELLIATILSAQCTDERVNKVTPALFEAANTPEKIIKLGDKKLIEYIRSTGFYNSKAKSIMGCAEAILEIFDGKVPETLEELQKLPGVGRKTASVVLIHAFGIPAFPVDRHVLRVANRLGLAHAKTPDETDEQLRKAIPEKLWIRSHLQLVFHGRGLCRPKPKCEICPLLPHCSEGQKRVK